MKTHDLKLSIEFCDAVLRGEKTFEVRKNDRGFQIKTFLKGFCTRSSSCPTLIFTKPKLKFKRRQTCVPDVCEIEISYALQSRILEVIGQYIHEKEKEQKEL